ncbi:MAG: hypothetical protein CO080_07940 [Nitrospirae bacterium CG_4_9_14_0_8_um_filter_70_14]|nr:MAG: hypothetical protein CO080_07940 [Nitrospirae bacterium CG_4_9_14_0_8_um_filter_70_14]
MGWVNAKRRRREGATGEVGEGANSSLAPGSLPLGLEGGSPRGGRDQGGSAESFRPLAHAASPRRRPKGPAPATAAHPVASLRPCGSALIPSRQVGSAAPVRRRLVRVSLRGCALVLWLLCAAAAHAAATCDAPLRLPAADAGMHAPWDGLLRSFVRNGVVDYGCMQAHEGELDRYLAELVGAPPEGLARAAQLALWINAYNAATVKLILRRYPQIRSIKEIPRRWTEQEWTVGGKRYSLEEIENEILRAKFGEPRIHFAINCASKSCPDLAAEAYVAARLDAQLDAATRRFLIDPVKGARVARARGLFSDRETLYLSAIFKWFRADFEAGQTVTTFVTPFLAPDSRLRLAAHAGEVRIDYLDYDWRLNGI